MPRYNRPFDITHRSDKICDTSQRLVALRVQATQVELFINLNAAHALGFTVPLPLSGRADEIIE